MRAIRLTIFLIALVLLTTAELFCVETDAQSPLPDGVQRITSVEGITEYSLPNGLHMLLFPDKSKQSATVNITYLVGSRNESYGESGMAHLLEHMAFKGTPSHRDIPKLLNERGAQFNATTDYDRTNYFETLPATDENLRWMLEFEADRMVNSFIARKDLDSEMTVVRNEFERNENNPGSVLTERMMSAAYLAHAYHRSVIGFRSDIENVPIERLQAFYKYYYQPDNAVLTVAGQFDESKALDWIVQTFGKIAKPQRALTKLYTLDPVQDGERSVTLRRVGDTQIVGVIYHVPDGSHPDFAAIKILSSILGDTPSGRLYRALVETKKAASVEAEAMQAYDPGVLMALATLPGTGNLDDARNILVQTVEGIAKTPPEKEEVDRARTALLKDKELTLRDSSRLGFEISEWIAMGDWRLFFVDRDRLRGVNPEDLARVAAKYLVSSNRTLGTFVPTVSPTRAEIPPKVDLRAMLGDYKGNSSVAQGESFNPTPTMIEERTTRATLANGMKVALLSKKTRGDLVVATLVLRFGDENSLKNLSAVSELTARMLERGTTEHTRQQLNIELDRLRTQVRFFPGVGQLTVEIESLRDNLKPALGLVAEMLQRPSFPANEFDILRQEIVTYIEASLKQPAAVARTEFKWRTRPYPAGHPRYSATMEEEIAEFKAVTLASVTQFHTDFYGAQAAQLAVVGDFDAPATGRIASDLFGGWKSKKPFRWVPQQYFEVPGQRKVIEVRDKADAMYLLGVNLNVREDDLDYPALLMANQILGGGMLKSRLADRIRQRDGLSYTVGSDFVASALDKAGIFMAFANFAPQNLGPLETAFREELGKVRKDGFTEDELKAAKSGWLQARQVQFAQDDAIASSLADDLFYNRTFVWEAEIEKRVEAVTTEEAVSAFRKYIDLAKLTVVTVGSFSAAEQLRP